MIRIGTHAPRTDRGDAGDERSGRRHWWRRKILAGLGVAALLLAIYAILEVTDFLQYFTNVEVLREQIERLGIWGPLVVIALMAANIVFSPLPGAPILIAAGAAYGSFWGTVYVLIGAELGALAAFFIARMLGADVVQRWFGEHQALRIIGSQTTLMGIVFVSRLVPFMSFDLLSYGAGLTPLTWWRFALANLAGMLPMYFIIVHFGYGIFSAEEGGLLSAAIAAAAVAAVAALIYVRLHRAGIAPPEAARNPGAVSGRDA